MATQVASEEETVDYGVQAKTYKKYRTMSFALCLTCIGFWAAMITLVVVVILASSGSGSDNSCNTESLVAIDGYILDGATWHTIFYRFTNQSGPVIAKQYCQNFKKGLSDINAVSVHCGVQNSIEQVSFGDHGSQSQNVANR